MSTPAIVRNPAVPAVVAGGATQLIVFLLPAVPVFTPLLAILLTAAAARIVTRNRYGASVPRAGLLVGAVSAGLGLLLSGLGLIAILVAVLTLIAGVAGAVAGRPELRPGAR